MAKLLPIMFAVSAVAQTEFSTANWLGEFASGSGVLESIYPRTESSFTFTPTDYFPLRNASGNYHTGDISVRWRLSGEADWIDVDSALSRSINPINTQAQGVLLHSNFDNVWPDVAKYLSITRDWKVVDGDLVMSVTVRNTNSSTIELGGFGFPIEMNNIFWGRTAEEVTAKCVLVDPYPGLDAGYAQVTRLTGTGPNMVITPYGGKASRFEAWRQLSEDISQPTGYQSQTFEGVQAWQTLSLGYAQREWSAADPWNTATSQLLRPKQAVTFALRFSVAPQVFDIESTVSAAGIPVAVGVPGYILPSDLTGRLFLKYTENVKSISTTPSDALSFTPLKAQTSSYQAYAVASTNATSGRVRATVSYADGTVQSIHYVVTNDGPTVAVKHADFLFNQQWYNDTSDPFQRAPSVISYDNEARSLVLQEPRVWIAGLSDDAGSGPFEAAALTSSIYPNAEYIMQLELMAQETVWGWLQDKNDTDYNTLFGVKRSLFFYDTLALPMYPYSNNFNWNQGSWNRHDAYQVWRAYNYVHVSALYWSLYRADRSSPGVLNLQEPTWYLNQSYNTAVEITKQYANGTMITAFSDVGLMCESFWVQLLGDLLAEKMTVEHDTLQFAMQARQKHWASLAEPFGSEQAWDSTGQEGVYAWSRYFGDNATMTKALNSIRGYMPTVPHWGYNGNARRYWDFTTAGKISQIERQIHHYGSALNAIPMLDSYMHNSFPSSPSAIYDLRVGYGGHMAPLSNHNFDGFASVAFHSYPDLLKWDPYSGDYGLGWLGLITQAVTILVQSTEFGWISMGGNWEVHGDSIVVKPRDVVRRRIYVAEMGLSLEVDAGQITQFVYNTASKRVTVDLDTVDGLTTSNNTMVYKSTLGKAITMETKGMPKARGGYVVPLPITLSFTLQY